MKDRRQLIALIIDAILTPILLVIILFYRDRVRRAHIDLSGGWGRFPLAILISSIASGTNLFILRYFNPAVIEIWPLRTYLMGFATSVTFFYGTLQTFKPNAHQSFRTTSQTTWLFWSGMVGNLLALVFGMGLYHPSLFLAMIGQTIVFAFAARNIYSQGRRDPEISAAHYQEDTPLLSKPMVKEVVVSRSYISLVLQLCLVLPFQLWHLAWTLQTMNPWIHHLCRSLIALGLLELIVISVSVFAHYLSRRFTFISGLCMAFLTFHNILSMPYTTTRKFELSSFWQVININQEYVHTTVYTTAKYRPYMVEVIKGLPWFGTGSEIVYDSKAEEYRATVQLELGDRPSSDFGVSIVSKNRTGDMATLMVEGVNPSRCHVYQSDYSSKLSYNWLFMELDEWNSPQFLQIQDLPQDHDIKAHFYCPWDAERNGPFPLVGKGEKDKWLPSWVHINEYYPIRFWSWKFEV